MQTTIIHKRNEFLVYVALGSSLAIALYPFWLFNSRGKAGVSWFGLFYTPRGWGVHLGLFGAQVFNRNSKPKRIRELTGSLVPIPQPEYNNAA